MRSHSTTHNSGTNWLDIVLGRKTASHPAIRLAQLCLEATVIGTAMTIYLNALFIGGVPALLAGVFIGQAVETWLFTLGITGLGATGSMWLTVVIVWAIPTVPGVYLLDT